MENEKLKQNKKIIRLFLCIGGIFLFLIILSNIIAGPSMTPQKKIVAKNTISKHKLPTKEIKPEKIKKVWNFDSEVDEMTSSKNIWASITSDNTVEEDEPYEETDCSIIIRYTKRYGTDAIINIRNGQIYGNEYEDQNYILAKFDHDKPIKYRFNEDANGSSEDVFIQRKSDFIRRCKKAKSIKIELPLYQGGRPVFDFSVDEPLKWKY